MKRERLDTWLPAVLGAALFGVALAVLFHELRDVRYRDLAGALAALPRRRIFWAVVLTAANYAVLTGNDQLAFRYIDRRIKGWRIALASFVSYAISNNVGFALISGTTVRYRFYARWGVDAGELSRIVLFYTSTFWLGLLALGGWSLAFHPHPALRGLAAVALLRALGAVLLAVALAYLVASFLLRRTLRLKGYEFALPRPRLALLQFGLSSLDWMLAAAVLWALLPDGGPPFGVFLGVFLAAQLLGVVSHVPGGVGVFEGILLVLLGDFFAPEQVLSSLVLYRIIYYLLPLAAALALLVADEIRLRRRHLTRAGAVIGALTRQLAPTVLAVFTFLAGVVLLFSGATPAEPRRLRWLARWLPLGVFEASHFLGSTLGVALLFVAQGVKRRLDVAYYLALIGLAFGMVFSLLKAADYEEALFLGMLLLAFVPARDEFDRRAAFLDASFSPGWTAAAVAAVGASIWLGLFAYKHVEYANELWWQVALSHDVSRFLRASVGATVALLAFGMARLFRPAAPEVPPPTDDDLANVERIARTAPSATLTFLAFLRDKALLFDDARKAFVMYAVQGRTWVALGDPVGPVAAAPAMIRRFIELADDFGGTPVFYQVRHDRLHSYADFGLTLVKLGEEARVALADFSLEGSANRGLRNTLNRLSREGVQFRIVPAHEVAPLLDELREVSADWLARKRTAEKGFSLGFFDPAYIARFPVAVLTLEGRIVAFANLWLAPQRDEMSVDLMRFRDDAPKAAMDALFLKLMLWGRDQGYSWFSLGMAPLSGVVTGPLARAWTRVAHWVFRYGEAFYNFQGVRTYKEKFHPVWEPRYLAYPGGPGLPRLLADITALVAGGYRRIFR